MIDFEIMCLGEKNYLFRDFIQILQLGSGSGCIFFPTPITEAKMFSK